MRKIQVFSNAQSEQLDYKKKYTFHHWLRGTNVALIEDEDGNLLHIKEKGNFKFVPEKEVKPNEPDWNPDWKGDPNDERRWHGW